MARLVLPTWAVLPLGEQALSVSHDDYAVYNDVKNVMYQHLIEHTMTDEIINKIKDLIQHLLTQKTSIWSYIQRGDKDRILYPHMLHIATGIKDYPWEQLLAGPCDSATAKHLIDLCLIILAFSANPAVTGKCRRLVERVLFDFPIPEMTYDDQDWLLEGLDDIFGESIRAQEEQKEWEQYCDDLYLAYHGHREYENEDDDE